jgi:hypothetical protein
MLADETGQAQAEENPSQALARLGVSQTPSVNENPPSSMPPPHTLDSPSSASPMDHLVPARTTFLGLPREIRDMMYGQILTVDPDPPLIDDDDQPFIIPCTQVLRINSQVRSEAMEILRSQNTWVVLVINGCENILQSRLQEPLCRFLVQYKTPSFDELSLSGRQRRIVIEIGFNCGNHNRRPLCTPHTMTCLFAYNRQGFQLFCMLLWRFAPVYQNMTVIMNMAQPYLGCEQIVQDMVLALSRIRGLQNAACLSFPQLQAAQRLERLMTNQLSWGAVFHYLKVLIGYAGLAVDATQREEAIHRHRIACIAVNHYSPSPSSGRFHRLHNACLAIAADFAYKKGLAILTFVSSCHNESEKRFASLSKHLIGNAVQEGNRALFHFPGANIESRQRAYELRGRALMCRAEYNRLKNCELRQIRSDLETAVLDFYFSRLLVDRLVDSGSLEVDKSLEEAETQLGTGRSDTTARAQIESVADPSLAC